MKLLNRLDFLKLPEGTIFSFFDEELFMNWDDLCIKGDSSGLDNDFVFQSLFKEIGFEFADDSDNNFLADEKLQKGESINLDEDCYSRDGYYDNNERFIVYEKSDIEKIMRNLQKGLNIS